MSIDKLNKELIFRYFQDLTNSKENKEILEWVKKDADNKKVFLLFKEIWDGLNFHNHHQLEGSNWEELSANAKILTFKPHQKFGWVKEIAKYAAIFIFGLLSFILYQNFPTNVISEETEILYNEINVPKGSKTQMLLPDGTRVWLNAGSSLKYAKDFGDDNRIVHLQGEGYFEVMKNEKQSFTVKTPGMNVSALGTKFNVKAYAEDVTIEATLVEGKVKIENDNKTFAAYEPIYLLPNQTVIFHKNSNAIELSNTKNKVIDEPMAPKSEKLRPKVNKIVIHEDINPLLYTSWKDSRWVIDSERLGDLAVQFERMFDVAIKFNDKELKETRFSGTLKDESLEQVLNAMTLTAPINYKIKGKQVILMNKK